MAQREPSRIRVGIKKRIVMQVNSDGTASLDFLDAEGTVVRHLIPSN
jgi:hypothetical protein